MNIIIIISNYRTPYRYRKIFKTNRIILIVINIKIIDSKVIDCIAELLQFNSIKTLEYVKQNYK